MEPAIPGIALHERMRQLDHFALPLTSHDLSQSFHSPPQQTGNCLFRATHVASDCLDAQALQVF
jgi:hypothetical protein